MLLRRGRRSKEMGHWFKSEEPHRGGAERLARPPLSEHMVALARTVRASTGESAPGLTTSNLGDLKAGIGVVEVNYGRVSQSNEWRVRHESSL